MPVKLNGSTSGFSQLQAAAVAASNTLTLPASNGTLLADDGSGNVTVTGSAYLATTSGNVGIGTTSAAASLTISKVSTALTGTANPYGLYAYPTASGATIIDAVTSGAGTTTLSLRTYNNGTYNRILLDASGNVQINGNSVADTTGYVNSRTNTRAWVRWTGSTGAVVSSYNVSSVTRNSTGDYTVNYTTALADANYAVIGMHAGDASYASYGVYMQQKSAPTTSSCAITTRSNAGTYVDPITLNLVIFGN